MRRAKRSKKASRIEQLKKLLNSLRPSAAAVLASIILITFMRSPLPFILSREQRKAFRQSIQDKSVKVFSISGDGFASGSHVVAPSGATYIITNFHVCQAYHYNNSLIDVALSTDESVKVEQREIVATDPKKDLCLIKPILSSGFKVAKSLERGDSVFLLGHPAFSELMLIEGEYVSTKEITISDRVEKGLTTAAEITASEISSISYGGNSGSAVLNSSGRLVGVLFASNTIVKLQNFMVPLDKVKEFLTKY